MITDTLTNLHLYTSLHPLFGEVDKFLKQLDISKLHEGKTELIKEKLYVIYETSNARKKEVAKLEVHRQFIDIQVPLNDGESMGWKSLEECKKWATPYDEAKDYGFFEEDFSSVLAVPRGSFALFFPHDAHAPLLGEGEFTKLVFKVAVK